MSRALPAPPASPPPTGETALHRNGRLWTAIVVLLWATLPMLKLEVSRVILFDFVVLGVLLLLIAMACGHKLTHGRWLRLWNRPTTGPFYAWWFVLICAGLASGLNAVSVLPWFVELMTFVYLGVMMWVMDVLIRDKFEDWITLGAVVFGIVCLITGIGALLDLLGIAKIAMFYPSVGGGVAQEQGTISKFSGFARVPNQWGSYFASLFPLLLALCARPMRRSWQLFFISCAMIGAFTIPASGGKMSLFVIALEVLGFGLLYLMLNQSSSTARRLLWVGIFGAVMALVYTLVFTLVEDVWTVNRSLGVFDFVSGNKGVDRDWRTVNWGWAMEQVERHPFIGIGLGNFASLYDLHEVHSTYLSLLTEAGPLAIIAYIAVLSSSIIRLTQALALSAMLKRDNLYLIALLLAVLGVVAMNITANLTRTRATMLVIWAGYIYGDHMIRQIRAQQRSRAAQSTRPA